MEQTEQKKHVLFASMLGNTLEFYDFHLYGMLQVILAKVFFPAADSSLSIMLSFVAASAGLCTRPLGAILFGIMGDRFGRKHAFTFSIFLSALPMLVIGCTPSYESIGMIAPFLIIIARMAQGLAYGGEYNGVAIFSLEHLSKSKNSTFPGMVGGVIQSSSSIGVLLAATAGVIVAYFHEVEWAWRVPFVLGSLIGFVGFYIRIKTTESPEFLEASKTAHNSLSFFDILRFYPRSCLVAFAFGAFVFISSVRFLTLYMHQYLHISLSEAILFNACGPMTCVIVNPIFGLISDFFDRRTYFVIAIIGFLIGSPIIFGLLQNNTTFSIIAAQILVGLCYSCILGPQHAFLQSLFPVEARYRGISINYCLGSAIFGSIAQPAMIFLMETTGNINTLILLPALSSLLLMISLTNLGQPNNQLKKFDDFRTYSRK